MIWKFFLCPHGRFDRDVGITHLECPLGPFPVSRCTSVGSGMALAASSSNSCGVGATGAGSAASKRRRRPLRPKRKCAQSPQMSAWRVMSNPRPPGAPERRGSLRGAVWRPVTPSHGGLDDTCGMSLNDDASRAGGGTLDMPVSSAGTIGGVVGGAVGALAGASSVGGGL